MICKELKRILFGHCSATKAVAAANAFLESLDAGQRAKVVLPFSSGKKAGWSNLPVTIEVYDLLGQKTLSVMEHVMHAAGTYSEKFDTSQLPSGSYVVRVSSLGGALSALRRPKIVNVYWARRGGHCPAPVRVFGRGLVFCSRFVSP